MNKSTFFTVEINRKIDLDHLKRIEDAINNEVKKFAGSPSAIVSNMQYKKGAYF